jgi:hypothetical protein
MKLIRRRIDKSDDIERPGPLYRPQDYPPRTPFQNQDWKQFTGGGAEPYSTAASLQGYLHRLQRLDPVCHKRQSIHHLRLLNESDPHHFPKSVWQR